MIIISESPVPSASNDFSTSVSSRVSDGITVIGFKNITDHAGATTLTYMIKNE